MSEKKNVPEIRFEGFSGAWEQDEVRNYCEMFNGDRSAKYPNAQDMVTEGIPFINAGDLENGHVNLRSANKISRQKYDDLSGAKLQLGDIVYCLRGTLGKNAYIDKFNEGTVASSLVAIRPKNIDGRYLFHVLNSDIEYRQRVVHDEGAAQPNLSAKSVSEFIVPVPNKAEQGCISSFLDYFDTLLTLQQRKCERLKNVKKSMLEKVFPREGSDVPEIRFEGFSGAWERKKLGDSFDCLQNNTLSRAELSSSDGAAKNIHYGDVLIKFGEYLDTSKATLPFIGSQCIVDKYKSSFLRNGDIIMADTAEDETVGKCAEIAGLQNIPLLSGLHTIPIRPKMNFAPGYLGYYMNSNAYHNQLLPLMQGIKVTSVSKKAIESTRIVYPSNLAEQAAIGQHFICLDHLITLHQQKYEKLKQLKQSLLEKMFV